MNKSYAYLILTYFLVLISCSSDTDEPQPDPDVIAPTVNFEIAGFTKSSTSESIVASGQIEVNINAEDAGGILKVEAFIDDQKVGEDTTSPYQITIDISSFESKIGQTDKFKNYTLKIVVTDTSGNTTTSEQTIHIDNELPVISEVTLEADTIINGNTNAVTFNVSDNEGLSVVKIYLNNELISEITDANYELNIDTRQLDDGDNTFIIEAIDLAENTATFEVSFVSDNTGPEITLESFDENQIIDESITLSPVVSDPFSSITSVEFLVGEDSQLIIQGGNSPEWTINPDDFETGVTSFYIIAKDSFGNENIKEFPIQIQRRLLTINVPGNRVYKGMKTAVAFVSRMDGTLIQSKEILREESQLIFSVAEEFDIDTEFMLSFYLEENPNGHAAYISTHQNLTRNNPKIINLAAPKYLDSSPGYNTQLPITNFLWIWGKFCIPKLNGGSYCPEEEIQLRMPIQIYFHVPLA